MFYQEFKSSRKSSSKTRSQSNQEAGTAGRSHAGTNADVRRSRMHGMNLKNGGNSVVIMSSSRWQESQEALKDMRGSDGLGESLSSHHGILRTEEVKIHRDSASGDNSIELGPMGMGTESESSSHQTDHRVDHKY